MRICVYAAGSAHVDPIYFEVAKRLGAALAQANVHIVYGGGRTGLMGAVADAALANKGTVTGIIPRFMTEVEWQHNGVTSLEIVEDMRERKHRLLTNSDAVIALPGGCGTLEELLEAITLKRLGIYFKPIILLNTKQFWTPFHAFMQQIIDAKFMNPEHAQMWSLVDEPEQALPTILTTPAWHENARSFAAVKSK